MRKWTPLLLATAVLHLSLPGPARAAEPCLTNCQAEGPGAAGAPLDREAERARDAEEQRLDEQRRRLEKAERARAELEQAQADQRRLETFEEESVSATRRRVGGMALTMAATTGCLTGLALYLGTKGTRTGERSYRPIALRPGRVLGGDGDPRRRVPDLRLLLGHARRRPRRRPRSPHRLARLPVLLAQAQGGHAPPVSGRGG